jgi:8-oxo-dGTP pyrophosphatase MutT (NUDIX family)
MALYEQYYDFKKSLERSTNDEIRYQKYITMLNEMSKDEMIVGSVLDAVVNKHNGLLNEKISYENVIKTYEFREYSLCVLFNSSKNIFISLRHEIPGSDYNGKYQVTGGKVELQDRKKKDYFLACAKREAFEESGIIFNDEDLIHAATEENSRIFPKKESEDIYRTAVYIADIADLIPLHKEPEKNGEWEPVDFKEIRRLRDENCLTETLGTKLETIIDKINEYLRMKNRCRPKKRKHEENVSVNNDSDSLKEVANNNTNNCEIMICDGENCDDIISNGMNHTTVNEEEIEEEILKIV